MKTSLRSHLLLALLVMLVTFGSAEPVSATEKVSYNYGSASYFLGDDVQGAQILASGQAHKNLRLVFDYRYTDVDVDVAGVDVSSHGGFAGVGYLFRQIEWVDIIADLGGYFASVEVDVDFLDDSTTIKDGGAFAGLRARILPTSRLEVEPFVRYFHSLEDGQDQGDNDGWDFGIEGRYFLGKNFALQASVEDSDFFGETVFSLGFRFGQQRDPKNF